MEKARQIIVGIVSATYLILILMKVDIPRNVFIALVGIILINQAIDEWNEYKETKKKIHLLIPITLLSIIIFVVLNLLF
ncbi:MAG: hypothetical protein KZY61_03380 [Clostridiaceae bacterium]|uniref:Uncharacterized protein n=1 Tax=Anaerosalibacter bizertensis TaxID=932217 RepID=A0A9Q4AE59_9FIRM|nr:hypothetical protein [Anaerosalibacter bizertensis]MBV1820436.1 hypothetical protein [Bacteroidales bacterium MSK.15.36]MBW4828301.1 hypothetical protein [Clostridiaceae bacterium]MBW4861078.1 hypothetical protein [Clostridiaceae bacterium]MBW4867703.1 hypothetical protein [Clostridiaceae bacterium]MCB5560521.1 hypothetical protein [Anaerosalibacter bizertensis]